MRTISVETKVISSQQYSAICIGEVSHEMPRHLLTGEQEKGYVYKDGELSEIYYSKIQDIDGRRYIFYPYMPLECVTELACSLRSQAKTYLSYLSAALQKVPSKFLAFTNGIIPTWRIFFIKESGVLLLPEKVSNLILYSASEEDREEHLHRYIKPDLLAPFALTHQMFQLLYLSAARSAPYAMKETREVKWKHVPLSLGFTSVDSESCKLIDEVLGYSQAKMREEFSGAYSGSENLSWFDMQLEKIDWNVSDDDPGLTEAARTNSDLAAYLGHLTEKANRRIFWRKKGFAVTAAATAAVILLFSVVQIIVKANEPPYTSQMDEKQIIEEFFRSQNELDIQKMNASLTSDATNPFETEVSTLFVSSRMREAYEGIDSVITPEQYLEGGEDLLLDSAIIYGTDDLVIRKVDEDTYDAEFEYWTSQVNQNEDDPEDLVTMVKILRRTLRFDFTDTKGYLLIEAITPGRIENVREFVLEP